MSSKRREHIELAIWKEIAGENLSASHDHWHIDRVLDFASQLQALYGGDLEVITAAVILHDLGRGDPRLHGQDSIEESIAQAREILEKVDLPPGKVEQVIKAIEEHDKPKVRPSTIEGRILKEADFLGGFGAWGILRIGLWAGETGEGIAHVMDRLEHRMPVRLESLEFPESESLARKEMMFAHLFLSLLRQPPKLEELPQRGKYIVFEGISGSGKDTQADLLEERLRACGHTVVRVYEPADVYRELRDTWRNEHNKQLDDPVIMKFLLMADRYELMQEKVRPALERGNFVISVRSFVSTLVYQCDSDLDMVATAFAHRFVPLPDVLVVFDLEADTAWTRIEGRTNRGIYETRGLLHKHRARYREVCSKLFDSRVKTIDASKPIDEVADRTWKAIESILHRSTLAAPKRSGS